MASYNKINSFVEDLGKKRHDLSADTLTLALTTTALAPVATNTALANLTEISYTNCSTRVCTITSYLNTTGTSKLILAQLMLTASGTVGPFGEVCLYNATAGSPTGALIAWWAYGSDITLASTETFTAGFDTSAGVLTIA